MPFVEQLILCTRVEDDPSGMLNLQGFLGAPFMTDGPGHLERVTCVAVLSGMKNVSEYSVEIQLLCDDNLIAKTRAMPLQLNALEAEDHHIHRSVISPVLIARAGTYTFRLLLRFSTGDQLSCSQNMVVQFATS